MSISTLRNYADYQASTFRDALKDDSKKEKRKNQKTKNPKVAVTKMGVFELSDQQFQINMGEIQKLPNFMKFYSGRDSNLSKKISSGHIDPFLMQVGGSRIPEKSIFKFLKNFLTMF